MLKYGAPARLWDNAIKYHAYIISHNLRPEYECLKGRVPHDIMGGTTPVIYQYSQFNYYRTVWYWDPKYVGLLTKMGDKLRSFYSIDNKTGQEMCFNITPKQIWSPF